MLLFGVTQHNKILLRSSVFTNESHGLFGHYRTSVTLLGNNIPVIALRNSATTSYSEVQFLLIWKLNRLIGHYRTSVTLLGNNITVIVLRISGTTACSGVQFLLMKFGEYMTSVTLLGNITVIAFCVTPNGNTLYSNQDTNCIQSVALI